MVALRIAGIVPKADLAGDLTRRGGCIARYDLHTDPRIEALTHRCGDILPHGIENRGHGRKTESSGRHGPQAVGLGCLGPGDGQRTHGMVLKVEQPGRHLGIKPVGLAHAPHNLRGTLHAEQAPARDAALDDRCHILALGREGQPIDDRRPAPQGFVLLAATTQPLERSAFGRVSDDAPLGIEERRRIQGDDLGEIMFRKCVVTHQLLHVHLVLRQRAGLVRTDHRHGAHRFAGMHLPYQVVRLEHPPHGHGQRQRDRHRQTFGHRHHDDGHRDHKDVEHLLRNRQPVLLQQVTEEKGLADHHTEDQDRKSDADPPDQLRKACQLAVQRGGFVVLHGRLLGNAARLGTVTHGRDHQHAIAVGHRRPAHHDIRRIGRLRIEVGFVHRFVHFGLAREGRFVDLQRHGFDQLAVGRNRLAALDVDHIADHDLPARNLTDRTVAHHLHRNVVVHLVQPPETALRIPLEPETDTRGEDDRADDADRFGEVPVDETDNQRQHRGKEQDPNDRIAELVEQKQPGRSILRRRDDIVAVPLAAGGDLLRSEAPGIVSNHLGQNLLRVNCRVEASSRTAMNNRIVNAMSDEPP